MILNYFNKAPILLRLLLIFSSTAVGILFLFTLIFHLFGSKEQYRDVGNFFADYGLMLVQRIGTPPNKEQAQQLADELGLIISIMEKGQHWSTAPQWYAELQLQNIPFHNSKFEQVQLAHYRAQVFIKVQQADTEILISHSLWHGHDKALSAFLLSSLLTLILLYFSYRSVKKLFNPIQDLEHASLQFSQGHFEHRIKIKCQSELGRLASVMNDMAAQINKMLQAKRQMLLAISHELRTPLTRLKLATELLEGGASQNVLRKDIAEMEQLISELLESERLQDKHQVLNLQEVELHSLLHKSLAELSAEDVSRIDMQVTAPEQQVQLDPVRIKLLLKNLLRNALQHSEQTVLLKVEIETKAEQVANLTLIVEDQGCGIAKEHIHQLTEAFYRVDDARLRKTGGYGLGLYLCKLISDAHGGQLQIDSEVGVGTQIRCCLPVKSTSI